MPLSRLIALLLFLSFEGFGSRFHQELAYFDKTWDQIRLAGPEEQPNTTDTSVIIYTTRSFQPDNRVLFANSYDQNQAIKIVKASQRAGKWTLYLIPDLKTALADNQYNNYICYVEGMGKTFPIALSRAYNMALQYNSQIIMFDYPSINPDYSAMHNYNFSRKNAAQATPFYLNFLIQLQEVKKSKQAGLNWSLIHHSMGNIMLEKMLKQNLQVSLDSNLFNTLIINAACVRQVHHAKWVNRIHFSKTVYINYNKDDHQLNGVYLITHFHQLGQKIHKPFAASAYYVDFNLLVGSRHSTFVNVPRRRPICDEAFRYYNQILHGEDVNFDNSVYFQKCRKTPGYSILPVAIPSIR